MQLKKLYWANLFFLFLLGIFLSSCVSRRELAGEYYSIAQDMFIAQNYKQALTYFQQATKLYPSSAKGDFNIIMIHLLNRNYDEAQRNITILLENDPNNTEVWELQAYLYYHQGKPLYALAIYEWILSQDIIKDRIAYNAIQLHWELYNTEAVIELYSFLTQPSIELQWIYIQSLTMEEKIEEALSVASDYRRDLNAEQLMDLGNWYEQRGDFEETLTVWEELLTERPGDSELLFRKAHILLVQRVDFSQGVKVLEEAIISGFSDTVRLQLLLKEDLFDAEAVRRVIEQ